MVVCLNCGHGVASHDNARCLFQPNSRWNNPKYTWDYALDIWKWWCTTGIETA